MDDDKVTRMKTNTSDLTGTALDWAVAKCEGYLDDCNSWLHQATLEEVADSGSYHPSTDWAYGGPIIEQKKIDLFTEKEPLCLWAASVARYQNGERLIGWRTHGHGPTPLIAAMRCYVASKLGDTVDVPDELMGVPMKA